MSCKCKTCRGVGSYMETNAFVKTQYDEVECCDCNGTGKTED